MVCESGHTTVFPIDQLRICPVKVNIVLEATLRTGREAVDSFRVFHDVRHSVGIQPGVVLIAERLCTVHCHDLDRHQ